MVDALRSDLDEFLLSDRPTLGAFLQLSQSLKDLEENIDFRELMDGKQYPDLTNKLADQIVAFWAHSQTQIERLFKDRKVPLSNIAKVAYGLRACVHLDKKYDFFGEAHWLTLRPAICKLMRVLINHIHKKNLLIQSERNPIGLSQIGSILAILAWIEAGRKHKVPEPQVQTSSMHEVSQTKIQLLSGFKRTANGPSLLDITQAAINCLLDAEINSFDTRQLAKMLMLLGRMINSSFLSLVNTDTQPWIDRETLANKLVLFSKSSLMIEYKQQQHNAAQGHVDPVVVDNLCEALMTLFNLGVLDWSKRSHVKVAARVANLIIGAMSPGNYAHDKNKHQYRLFLEEALSQVSSEQAQPFMNARREWAS